jgi:hypothetical protein
VGVFVFFFFLGVFQLFVSSKLGLYDIYMLELEGNARRALVIVIFPTYIINYVRLRNSNSNSNEPPPSV